MELERFCRAANTSWVCGDLRRGTTLVVIKGGAVVYPNELYPAMGIKAAAN